MSIAHASQNTPNKKEKSTGPVLVYSRFAENPSLSKSITTKRNEFASVLKDGKIEYSHYYRRKKSQLTGSKRENKTELKYTRSELYDLKQFASAGLLMTENERGQLYFERLEGSQLVFLKDYVLKAFAKLGQEKPNSFAAKKRIHRLNCIVSYVSAEQKTSFLNMCLSTMNVEDQQKFSTILNFGQSSSSQQKVVHSVPSTSQTQYHNYTATSTGDVEIIGKNEQKEAQLIKAELKHFSSLQELGVSVEERQDGSYEINNFAKHRANIISYMTMVLMGDESPEMKNNSFDFLYDMIPASEAKAVLTSIRSDFEKQGVEVPGIIAELEQELKTHQDSTNTILPQVGEKTTQATEEVRTPETPIIETEAGRKITGFAGLVRKAIVAGVFLLGITGATKGEVKTHDQSRIRNYITKNMQDDKKSSLQESTTIKERDTNSFYAYHEIFYGTTVNEFWLTVEDMRGESEINLNAFHENLEISHNDGETWKKVTDPNKIPGKGLLRTIVTPSNEKEQANLQNLSQQNSISADQNVYTLDSLETGGRQNTVATENMNSQISNENNAEQDSIKAFHHENSQHIGLDGKFYNIKLGVNIPDSALSLITSNLTTSGDSTAIFILPNGNQGHVHYKKIGSDSLEIIRVFDENGEPIFGRPEKQTEISETDSAATKHTINARNGNTANENGDRAKDNQYGDLSENTSITDSTGLNNMWASSDTSSSSNPPIKEAKNNIHEGDEGKCWPDDKDELGYNVQLHSHDSVEVWRCENNIQFRDGYLVIGQNKFNLNRVREIHFSIRDSFFQVVTSDLRNQSSVLKFPQKSLGRHTSILTSFLTSGDKLYVDGKPIIIPPNTSIKIIEPETMEIRVKINNNSFEGKLSTKYVNDGQGGFIIETQDTYISFIPMANNQVRVTTETKDVISLSEFK